MSFNPDHHKQAQEVIFFSGKLKPNHPSLNFNNLIVTLLTTHQHLGMNMDSKLDL